MIKEISSAFISNLNLTKIISLNGKSTANTSAGRKDSYYCKYKFSNGDPIYNVVSLLNDPFSNQFSIENYNLSLPLNSKSHLKVVKLKQVTLSGSDVYF